MQRWGPIWRVLIRPALACFTARFRSLHLRARTSSTKSWDPMFVQMSTRRARHQMVYVILWGQSAQLERRGSSLHFRWMGWKLQNSLLSCLWARVQPSFLCYSSFRGVLQVSNQPDRSLWRSCKSSPCWCVWMCSPGSSSAGLIIRADRWRWLTSIGVFDYYCIKVPTDTCSSRHGNGAA